MLNRRNQNVENENSSKRGKQVEEALKNLGNGLIIKKPWKKVPVEVIEFRLKKLWKMREDQDPQREWIYKRYL